MRHHGAVDADDAEHVGVELAARLVVGDEVDGGEQLDAGVVDHDMDATFRLDDRVDRTMTEALDETSSSATSTSTPIAAAASSNASGLAGFRIDATTWCPCPANVTAVRRPNPELQPVTRTVDGDVDGGVVTA